MPVGYRTWFTVDAEQDALRLAHEQLRSWLEEKGFTAEIPARGRVRLSDDADLTILTLDHNGSAQHTWRARLRETNDVGRWVSTLTVHVEPDGSWVWLDIDAPTTLDGRTVTPGVPRLARHLLSVLHAKDSNARLADAPIIADVDDVDQLVHAICDPERRSVLLIAGSHDSLPLPLWVKLVRTVMHLSVGLAAGYVLTPAATEALAREIGPSHAANPGTIRTYLPGADPASAEDARRHRWLGPDTLAGADERILARRLSRFILQRALETPVPSQVQRLGRALDDVEVELATEGLLSEAIPAPVSAPAQVSAPVTATIDDRPEARSQAPQAHVDVAALDNAAVLLRLQDHGLIDPTVTPAGLATALNRLVADLEAAVTATAAVADLREVIDTRTTAAQETIEDLDREREAHLETQVELSYAEDERRALAEKVRRLEGELVAASPESLGAVLAADTSDPAPESYTALLKAIDRLEYVVFTGDPEITTALSDHDPFSTFLGKLWDGARALNDYARAQHTGAFTGGGFHEYIRADLPADYRRWPDKQYAATESEDVRSNPKYERHRQLPVPRSVHRSQRVSMYAHLKCGQRGLVSPRLHFHDDTRRTGKIYIGYIGPHLPTRAAK